MGKKQQYLTVDGRKIPVSNLEKVLYPGGRVTKAQVIDYYLRTAPVEWDELATAMDKEDVESLFFGVEDIIERLRRVGDLFKPVLTIKQ
ncbi:MAG TPA: hypothetical protein VKK06_04485, partial [Terriglobia bacterium]|nr:hypothetical protein [Terriglobia bacterium]